VRMSRLSTLLLSGPAPPAAVAVWFGDLPLDCSDRVLLRPAQPSTRDGRVVSQAGGRREVTDHCWPGATRPMHGDLAGDGPGLAGERVHGGRAARARLWGLLVQPGPGMAELEAMFGLPEGGHPGIWFRARRVRPGVLALTPDGRISGHHKTIVGSSMAAGMTAQTLV